MNQVIKHSNAPSNYKYTVSRNQSGDVSPTEVNNPNAPQDFRFRHDKTTGEYNKVVAVPINKPIKAMEVKYNGRTLAYWDGASQELDLYNERKKRAIKYNVSDPTLLFQVNDEILEKWRV